MKLLKKLMTITAAGLMLVSSFSCRSAIDENANIPPVSQETGDPNPVKTEAVDDPEAPLENPFGGLAFSVNGGRVKLNTKVAITVSDPETVIHYTMDGTTPTEESPVYKEPIVLTRDAVIRVVCEKEGMVSDCYKKTFNIYRQTGSKYSDEPKAVGDIVFADGSAEPYSEDLVLTGALKKKITGVVFNTPDLNNGCNKTLIIGLNRGEKWQGQWIANEELRKVNAEELISDVEETCPGSGEYILIKNAGKEQYVTGTLSGMESLSYMFTSRNLDHIFMEDSAFEAVCENYDYGFYLPSLGEMELLSAQISIVEKALQKAGDYTNLRGYFWTSSQVYFDNAPSDVNYAWSVRLDNGSYVYKEKSSMAYVCGIREL